jgi:hypothetical protein
VVEKSPEKVGLKASVNVVRSSTLKIWGNVGGVRSENGVPAGRVHEVQYNRDSAWPSLPTVSVAVVLALI